MKFSVKRYWELGDSVEVEASSADEAIQAAHALPFDNAAAVYVPDSINSDPATDVQATTELTEACGKKQHTEAMKLVIIDLYGDRESLRVCEDKPGIDQVIAEFACDEKSDEPFDEFMERKGVYLFITRGVSLEHMPKIGAKTDSAIRRPNV